MLIIGKLNASKLNENKWKYMKPTPFDQRWTNWYNKCDISNADTIGRPLAPSYKLKAPNKLFAHKIAELKHS